MRMSLEEIFKRRLLVVSGKGGVGKTSVAAALGLLASQRGKKTLIAEVNAPERISQLFRLPAVGYKETKLAENLFAINVDPRSAFEEFIIEQIHSKKLYHLIFENQFVRSFLDATPGLNELLEIGKIWALTERDLDETGKKPKYDLVIIDAPATGHGLAFLNVPQVVVTAVRVGPLKTKAANIMNLVQDPQKTLLLIVTLAEEMPVNEALEMLQTAQTTVKIARGPLIVNAIFPPVFSETEYKEVRQKINKAENEKKRSSLDYILDVYQKKTRLQHFYMNKLKLGIGREEMIQLPYLFRSIFDQSAIKELAENLSKSISENTAPPEINNRVRRRK
jgi:anion-transporting  ArsA/GET3 family ATPase